VKRVVASLFVVLAACADATTATTTAPAPTTTTTLVATTTTVPDLPVVLEDCDQPPAPFSALCESYGLLVDWHVDRPVDLQVIAEAARAALREDLSDLPTAAPPRTLFCAVPHDAFGPFCDDLARVMATQRVDPKALMDRVVTHAIESALGPFTYYLSPELVKGFRDNGVVGGVGILLDATDAAGSRCARIAPSCPLRIVFVLEGNPGTEAGLQAGDVIVAVDGTPVDGQGFAATASKIAGDETGEVTLTIRRDGQEMEITLTRAPLDFPTVEYGVEAGRVAYLRISDFEEDIPVLVWEALEEMEGLWGTMVVDLRDNPGGYVHVVVDVASQFVSDGPILWEVEPIQGDVPIDSLGGGLATEGRVIVLVNGGTASAAEILAAALRDRRDAVVLGTPTFGKDAVQIAFDLRNGGRLHVAVARWLSPGGASVGNGGLQPDVEMELPQDMTLDDLIQAAVEAAR
jgi:carboxyl-terminal processing protease